MKPKRFTIVSDDETGWQALYIDGLYETCDESLRISEIVYKAGGKPVLLEYKYARVSDLTRNGFPFEERNLVIDE